jgi:hypothetical protein
MSRLRWLLLLLCAIAAPALSAPNDWIADVLGRYEGPVLNGGGIERGETELLLDAQGRLIGRYHIDDPQPFDGVLTDFHADAPYSGTFTWHDHFGKGVVHMVFDPANGRFRGLWGDTVPLDGHVFNGQRIRPRVGS